MSAGPGGILAYGYPLAGRDTFLIEEVNEDSGLELSCLPWLKVEPDEDGWAYASHEDFVEQGTKEIGSQFGKDWPVEFLSFGSGDASWDDQHGILLVTHKLTVSWDETTELDFFALDAKRFQGNWDGLLLRTVEALGIHPNQPEPSWLLAADTSG